MTRSMILWNSEVVTHRIDPIFDSFQCNNFNAHIGRHSCLDTKYLKFVQVYFVIVIHPYNQGVQRFSHVHCYEVAAHQYVGICLGNPRLGS